METSCDREAEGREQPDAALNDEHIELRDPINDARLKREAPSSGADRHRLERCHAEVRLGRSFAANKHLELNVVKRCKTEKYWDSKWRESVLQDTNAKRNGSALLSERLQANCAPKRRH